MIIITDQLLNMHTDIRLSILPDEFIKDKKEKKRRNGLALNRLKFYPPSIPMEIHINLEGNPFVTYVVMGFKK